MKQNIYAVVVTYNRLSLLKRAINYLQSQTLPLCGIVVVNNGSTDGTREWLDQQQGLTIVHQNNVGGSGGFYTGMKTAYELGADWLWCMDDDVWPAEDCLATLSSYTQQNPEIGIICPSRLMNGKFYYCEVLKFNLVNPFDHVNKKIITQENVGKQELIPIVGMVFEGPLISRRVVDKIGLPNKDMFILYDDSDYSYRATLFGFKVMLCLNAVLNKEYFPKKADISRERTDWKGYYMTRNMSYFCMQYGKNYFFRYLGALPSCLRAIYTVLTDNKNGKRKAVAKYIRAFIDGKRKKLGKMKQ